MQKETNATEAIIPAIAPEETVKSQTVAEEDSEAKIKALEEEKAKLLVEKANYQQAYLKSESKRKNESLDDEPLEEERLRKIVNEQLADSRLADIAREQDLLIKKALKENKELKLALTNKTTIPSASVGTHSESTPVQNAYFSKEQMDFLRKTNGWTDKDFERYNKNYQKRVGK